jgi:hypothetical protein
MNTNEPTSPNPSEGIREEVNHTLRPDANGQVTENVEARTEVTLAPGGAIVQKTWTTEREYGCGHDARRPRGGRCCEEGCFRDSCAECYTRCEICRVGLCLFHVRYLNANSGQKVPVCAHCQGVHQRRLFWRRFWAVILNPFITLDDTNK